jgi:hypothetical protein
MFYTAVWCTRSEQDFRTTVPLELLGESIKRHGSCASVTVVVLEGVERLSEKYLSLIRETYGFALIDFCQPFERILRQFPRIVAHYSRYERNCFLRWIVFKELFHGARFWHLDADVILHTSLDALAADTAGKTFMLQGCPVFVSIADSTWFDLYEANLRALEADIFGYSATAFEQKHLCSTRDAELANQSLYRNPIASDQDLLEYLVSSGKIIQAPAREIFNSRYYFVQNPLAIKVWHEAQTANDEEAARSSFVPNVDGTISIGPKKLAFTHFQDDFYPRAGAYLACRKLFIPRSVARTILDYSDRIVAAEGAHRAGGTLYKLMTKLSARGLGPKRAIVMRELMHDNRRLADLLNLMIR